MREANTLVLRDVFGRIDASAAMPGLHRIVDVWTPDAIVGEVAEFGSVLVAESRGVPLLHLNIGLDLFTERILDEVDEPLRELGCATGSQHVREVSRLSLLPDAFDQAAGVAAIHRFRDPSVTAESPTMPSDWWPSRYADAPLVYVTFGSVAGRMGFYADFYRRVLDSLADLPVRVLMTFGAGLDPLALGGLAPNVHLESWWPQDSVLGEVAVVVGHGGFGTLIATLARGVPQVIAPLFSADQYLNAERVGAVGIGISLSPGDPVSLRSADFVPGGPDLSELAEAVMRALNDQAIAESARTVAGDLAQLAPIADFVDLLAERLA